MNKQNALHILGLTKDADSRQIKKQYRTLMRQHHPDGNKAIDDSGERARQINAAYEYLCNICSSEEDEDIYTCERQKMKSGSRESDHDRFWNAPMNRNAYTERDILQYVHDPEGNILGMYVVGTGKYIWTLDEEYELFLHSVKACALRMLEQIDEDCHRDPIYERNPIWLAELVYLLTQTFVDAEALLDELVSHKNGIYHIDAMVEISDHRNVPVPGEVLYPHSMSRHRLYLKNQSGIKIGYLSFPDDRMYQIIIPLFEQRRVQVKIAVSDNEKCGKQTDREHLHNRKLELYIRMKDEDALRYEGELKERIHNLIEQYKMAAASLM